MEELFRTNDLVLLSFAESLLKEAGFHPLIFDQNMSVMEGSIGILARRLLVPSGEADEARTLMDEAGIGNELRAAERLSRMDAAAATTTDAFLGGRVLAVQPARGHHRSGLEAVLLAASVPAEATGLALDLGAGAGVAGLCLAARCAGVRVGLVERDPDLVALAERSRALPDNRALHGRVLPMALDINAAEAERAAAGLVRAGADIVLCNPPFHTAGRVRVSPAAARADAHVLADGLDPWLRFAAWALRPGGELVLTLAATSLPELFPALAGRFGGAAILPIHPRPGAAAHRLLVRAVRARRSAPSILPGLVLHGDAGSAFTAPVAALLRGEADLATTHPAWRQSP